MKKKRGGRGSAMVNGYSNSVTITRNFCTTSRMMKEERGVSLSLSLSFVLIRRRRSDRVEDNDVAQPALFPPAFGDKWPKVCSRMSSGHTHRRSIRFVFSFDELVYFSLSLPSFLVRLFYFIFIIFPMAGKYCTSARDQRGTLRWGDSIRVRCRISSSAELSVQAKKQYRISF